MKRLILHVLYKEIFYSYFRYTIARNEQNLKPVQIAQFAKVPENWTGFIICAFQQF